MAETSGLCLSHITHACTPALRSSRPPLQCRGVSILLGFKQRSFFFFFLKVNGHPGSEELDRGGTGGQRRGGAFRWDWCCRTVGAEAGSVWGRRISWAVCWLKQIHARGRSCTQLASSSHVRRRRLSSRDFREAWDENPLDIIVHTRMARLIWD